MVRHVVLTCLVLMCTAAEATPTFKIHATCAAKLARDPAHVQTLYRELARALGTPRTASGYTLDVALVELVATGAGKTLEIRVELRALLSDARGQVRWTTTSRATARGRARDRLWLEQDAISAAAQDVAKAARVHAR